MTPEEEDDAKVRKDLQVLAKYVDKQLPYGWGFVLLAFPYGAEGRLNYVSTADRPDVIRLMYEFIAATKEGWAEHEVPLGAAAEDGRLGMARQRVAELEGYLAEAGKILKETEARIKELEAEVKFLRGGK